MGKKRSSCDAAAHRPWRLLRLALLWARRGKLMKCRLMAELRHGAKYLKGLNNKHWAGSRTMDMIRYGERQLSFDDTPVIHLRMSRPASLRFMIPCIKPEVVDFDYDFGNDDDYVGWGSYGGRRSFMGCKAGDHGEERENRGVHCQFLPAN